jgi:ABC-type multidrug transport system fused ATPase/permease subunit
MQHVDQLRGSRTIFLIAHRLSTVRKADRIFVLERGRIVEAGSHSELLATRGIYSQMRDLHGTSVKPSTLIAA